MKPIYKQIIFRYVFALCLLLTTQLIFYILNRSLFAVNSFGDFFRILIGNLRFCLATLSVYLAPYLFFSLLPLKIRDKKAYRVVLSFFFFAGVEIMMVSNLIDCGYFRFTFKRLTFDIFNYLGVGGDFNSLIPQFVRDYWHLFVIFLILNLLLYFIDWQMRKKLHNVKKLSTTSIKSILRESFVFVVAILLLFVFQRGGFQYRPMGLLQATEYATTQNTALVLNTPYTLFRTIGKAGLEQKKYFSDTEVAKIFSPVHSPNKEVWADTLFKEPLQVGKTNVVLIIIESYAAEYLSVYNKQGPSYAPFIDSLAKNSLVFKGYSNGKRSIDGIPAIVSSLPLLNEESYITSPYCENRLGSIASTLRKKGYNTAFYHGGYNGTMNFNVFTNHVGFAKYYGKNEYSNDKDYDGNWGIFDEPFLQYMGKKISATKEPFLSAVFTLSSHHPYTIPKQHIGRFPKGTLIVHETVGYTDYAIKRFFDYAKTQSWFDNTLFVITADHSALTETKEFQTALGLYRIPIIFYSSKMKHGEISPLVMQQTDIYPTICDILHIKEDVFAFGQSIFSKQPHFYIHYSNGEYILMQDEYVSIYREGYATNLFNVKTDADMKNNIASQHPQITKEHTRLTQAIIQQYNNRLIKNRTLIK